MGYDVYMSRDGDIEYLYVLDYDPAEIKRRYKYSMTELIKGWAKQGIIIIDREDYNQLKDGK